MLKEVKIKDSVGMVLCHDITQIIPNKVKGVAFKKGHVIKKEDIPKLLKMGKESIYVLKLEKGFIHEDNAAIRIANSLIEDGINVTEPSEGKVNLIVRYKGLLKINVKALFSINEIEDILLSTIHTNQVVNTNQAIAGTRIIPLITKVKNIETAEKICKDNFPVITVKKLKKYNVGIITTGSEIFHGRIQDKFSPILKEKFKNFNCSIHSHVNVTDDIDMTVKTIHKMINDGAEMIVLTGGMSVDPDDRTPASIKRTGAKVITYGSPTFPGAMFMLAYIDNIPVLGLPGCVMFYKTTVFDLILPRILAGDHLTRSDFIKLSHGGFCLNCDECKYPVCGFGKGITLVK